MGGFSKGRSRSSSTQASADRSFIDPTQAMHLGNLWGRASHTALNPQANAFGAGLFGQGQQLIGGALGGGPFGSPLAQFAQAGNPFAQGQIDQLGQGLGRLFQQQIMPGLGGAFAGAGGLGGSRHALAAGQAAEGIGQQFQSGALDILGNSANIAAQAAQGGLGAQMAAMTQLPAMYGLGLDAAGMGPLRALAEILGSPSILSEGRSQGTSTSRSRNIGLNLLGGD